MSRRVLAPLLVTCLTVILPLARAQGAFREVDLVSDIDGHALRTDAQLVNPWGILLTPLGTFRVANNGTATSEAFRKGGSHVGMTFHVPSAKHLGPTGIVLNTARHAFLLKKGSHSAPSIYITCALDGSLSGWNPAIDAHNAIQMSHDEESVYTGLAYGRAGGQPFLYVADFRGAKVEVYDKDFEEAELDGDFDDPDLPDGYAPFNVQNVGGRLYVMYAKVSATGEEEAGDGLGFVSVFDTQGHFIKRFASNGHLNAPWGVARAPRGFGGFGGAILVGNFGDGRINAFNRETGAFLGTLENEAGDAIEIEGLWGIAFTATNGDGHHDGDDDDDDGDDDSANVAWLGQAGEDASATNDAQAFGRGAGIGANGQTGEADENGPDGHHRDRDGRPRLYFAAGIEDEEHGLFGYVSTIRVDDDDMIAPAGSPAASAVGTVGTAPLITLARNPVRPSTGEFVLFRLGATPEEATDVSIFDASGRLVAMPARGLRGVAEVRWDGAGIDGARVQSGIYFYRVQAGGRSAGGKLVLLP